MYMNNKVELTNFIDKEDKNDIFFLKEILMVTVNIQLKLQLISIQLQLSSHDCSCPRVTTNEKPCKHIFAFHLLLCLVSKRYIDRNTYLSMICSTKSVIPRRKSFYNFKCY